MRHELSLFNDPDPSASITSPSRLSSSGRVHQDMYGLCDAVAADEKQGSVDP